jgi:hypothetical protein
MNAKNKIVYLVIVAVAANLAFLRTASAAMSISTSCVYQKTGIPRSIITVEGKGLQGMVYARVYSMAEERWITSETASEAIEQGAIKFIFDSDPEAITNGASEITPNFNKNTEVFGSLLNATTNGLIAVIGAECSKAE